MNLGQTQNLRHSRFLKLTMQFFSFAVEKTIDKAKFGNIYL